MNAQWEQEQDDPDQDEPEHPDAEGEHRKGVDMGVQTDLWPALEHLLDTASLAASSSWPRALPPRPHGSVASQLRPRDQDVSLHGASKRRLIGRPQTY